MGIRLSVLSCTRNAIVFTRWRLAIKVRLQENDGDSNGSKAHVPCNVVETDYRSTDHRYLHLLSVLPFVRTHAVRKGKPHVKFCSQPFYRLRRCSAGGASNSRHVGSGYSVVDKSRGV